MPEKSIENGRTYTNDAFVLDNTDEKVSKATVKQTHIGTIFHSVQVPTNLPYHCILSHLHWSLSSFLVLIVALIVREPT